MRHLAGEGESITNVVVRLALDRGDLVEVSDADTYGIVPKRSETVRVSLYPTAKGVELLDRLSKRLGVSRSRAVELLVEDEAGS